MGDRTTSFDQSDHHSAGMLLMQRRTVVSSHRHAAFLRSGPSSVAGDNYLEYSSKTGSVIENYETVLRLRPTILQDSDFLKKEGGNQNTTSSRNIAINRRLRALRNREIIEKIRLDVGQWSV